MDQHLVEELEKVASVGKNDFKKGSWCQRINLRDFIRRNYVAYDGDESFLVGVSESTKALWKIVSELIEKERLRGGTLDVDTSTVSGITAYAPGYIEKSLETIVGLQTDAPLKRAIMPYGGIRVVERACEAYGFKLDENIKTIFTKYRKTHNDGVFDAYTPEIKAARSAGIITGLPDAYGRGRIIGDYRRLALYGLDRLIADKKAEKASDCASVLNEEIINDREEVSMQIRALQELGEMATSYGFDVSRPAENAQEAIQWTYFAYLSAIKQQDGAAMSLGRVSTFFDVYIERDIQNGLLDEEGAQELIDHFVMKLRMVRFLRTPEYNALFSGDPTWVTECIGGLCIDGRPLVTKTSFRFLNTLYTLGPSPEPNLTILWSENLPVNFKNYCAKVSIETSSIQYENDDMMRFYWGDDYGIACCVSAMRLGKQMQFFGARCNLAKALLYSINGGRDEVNGIQVGPRFEPIKSDVLDYDEVVEKFEYFVGWISELYVNALNIIHYMHDRYCYEALQMAFHDKEVFRTMATGIAGLSVVADALSAIKYAKVKVIRDAEGYATDFEIEGDYPKFGNNDDRVDDIAIWLVETFIAKVSKNKTYRNSKPTLSILTITSNVVYGQKTGSTPDGRKYKEPFAPGANPMHGRDLKGAIASLASVAKLPYNYAKDGISYTFSIEPNSLGRDEQSRIDNLRELLDGFFRKTGHHINVNVLEKEMLLDAMDHPEKYPQLTIRVSGYAVNFIKLTREQQLDVSNRTFHTTI
ncbi:MAG: formate C-acetyltransferase [Kiritimatiellae bacterium]|jgi:formate C-acetyltransferase|nr:formate C-acetyltransferase [Kiritimatiellia bacterium]